MSRHRRELAHVTKERDFLREAAAFFASMSTDVSDDPTMPQCVFHPMRCVRTGRRESQGRT